MSTIASPVPPCPSWCAQRHIPTWRTHTSDLGAVELNPGTAIDVGLAQYGDQYLPVVSLYLHSGDETTVLGLSPDRAAALRDLLTTAIDTLGSVR
jgi:hypothetical protein